MTEMVLTTFDWVPEAPRGFVRDLRVRWALEEAGLAYRVESVPFRDRADPQYAPQPFKQVPWLADGGITMFESGAILLHIAQKSEKLMPRDEKGHSAVIQWMFAAVNSVETAVLPTLIFKFAKDDQQTPGRAALEKFLAGRLGDMEKYLSGRTWLTEDFSAADILMCDALRLVEGDLGSACRAYEARAKARPAYQKALADQLAHFAAADGTRAGE